MPVEAGPQGRPAATDDDVAPSPPARPPASLPALPTNPLTALAVVVLVLIAVLAMREVAELVVPVVFGLFLALVAAPLVGAIERRGVGHPVALTGAIGVVLAIVLVTTGIIAFSIGELVVRIPTYEDRLSGLIDEVRDLLAQVGIVADPEALPAIISPGALVSLVRPVASAVSEAAVAIFVLAFTMIYALAGSTSLRARAEAAFGEGHPMFRGVERFGTDLRRYLLVRAQLGLFAAALVFALLFVLGVPLPALWSFLVFAASFIPTVGTIIALVPPTILALLDGGLLTATLVVVGFALVNVAQDYLLQPRMMGTELNLSPLVVFLSVIAWAWILGAAGALLAVPLTVGLVMVLDAFPSSRGIATLMRNRLDAPPGLVEGPDGAGGAATDSPPADPPPR